MSQISSAYLLRCAIILVGILGFARDNACGQESVAPSRKDVTRWEPDIAALEKVDDQQKHVRDAILCVGSSSIRRWDSIEEDMKPWGTLKRGYGGAKLTDLNHYADRLIGPHLGKDNPRRPRAVVVFVANDISGKKNPADPTPVDVGLRFEKLHRYIRSRDAQMPIFWIEVTPTGKRWHAWGEIQQATEAIRNVLNRDPHAYFIPTAGAFMDENDVPNERLFVADRLHLNEKGYDLWAALIKTQLMLRLGKAKSEAN